MKTGDEQLDKLNDAIQAAREALKAAVTTEEKASAGASLVAAEAAKAEYWKEFQSKSRQEFLRKFFGAL